MVVVATPRPDDKDDLFRSPARPSASSRAGSVAGARAVPLGGIAAQGAMAGRVAGVLGSLVSTALTDVLFGDIAITGGSTFVASVIGARSARR